MGKTYPLSDEGEQIEIKIRGSGRILGTRPESLACTLSYTTSGFGIPLEFRMNKDKGASLIIAKANFYLDGYEPFVIDGFRNFIQLKVLYSLDMEDVKNTLRELVSES